MESKVFRKYEVFCKYKNLKHEAEVVETRIMSLVEPSDCWKTYLHSIPETLLESFGESKYRMSGVQMDTVLFCGAAHLRRLEGGLTQGFLIGDGPGVGKGRQIAGIIIDNYYKGRTKAIWVSASPLLLQDARRDMKDILGSSKKITIFPLPKNYKQIPERKGVLFATYSSLASKTTKEEDNFSSRVDQIKDWIGGDFDGVIVFDESHRAKGYNPAENIGSLAGKAVMDLQEASKSARIVYVSATIATEPSEMRYMQRLGLWGKGSVFQNADAFIAAANARGVCGSEIVAIQLKRKGVLLSRHLSFAGIEFTKQSADLTLEQRKIYDVCAEMWQGMFKLICENEEKSSTKTQFWSLHQRFFRSLCVGFKIPTLLDLISENLNGKDDEQRAVIVGLQSTGEAAYKKFMKSAYHNDEEPCSPCRTMLEEFMLDTMKISPLSMGLLVLTSTQKGRHKMSYGNLTPRKFKEQDITRSNEERYDEMEEDNGSSNDESFEEHSDEEDEQSSETAEITEEQCDEDSSSDELSVESSDEDESNKPPCKKRKTCLDFTDKLNLDGSIEEIEEFLAKAFRNVADKLPLNPIDQMSMVFTQQKVAELTGRTEFQILGEKEGKIYGKGFKRYARGGKMNALEQQRFQSGEAKIAIISDASSTGISLHSYNKYENKSKRVHIVAETPWSATQAIQQMGRSNRTGQVNKPEYVLLDSSVPGERRFVATLAQRVMTLGALSKGDRRSSQTSIWKEQLLEPAVAKIAIKNLINHVLGKSSNLWIFDDKDEYDINVRKEMMKTMETVEIVIKDDKEYLKANPKMLHIEKFLNRVLGMKLEDQERLMDWLDTSMDKCQNLGVSGGDVEATIEDVGVFIQGDIEEADVKVYGLPDGDTTTIRILRIVNIMQWAEVAEKQGIHFYKRLEKSGQIKIIGVVKRKGKSGNLYLEVFQVESKSMERKSVHYIRENAYTFVDKEDAKRIWLQRKDFFKLRCVEGARSGTCKRNVCEHQRPCKKVAIISGGCFTLWANLEKYFDGNIRIATYESDTSKAVGIFVPHNALEKVLKEIEMISKISMEEFSK